MSMFEDGQYRWRETYFVLFDAGARPSAAAAKKAIAALGDRYQLRNVQGDDAGLLESLTVLAPDDFAALDVSYLDGEEVLEQRAELAADMERTAVAPEDKQRLKRLRHATARFDVLHFEHLAGAEEEDDDEDMLDPGAMLIVLEVLAQLTGGIAVDPQSGTFL